MPQNYPFHILLGTIKKLGAMTKTNPIWSMPLQLQLLWQLKYILNELKKFSFHWYYLEITKSQIYSILFFSIDKLLRSIHCWSFPSFLHHRWTVKGQWWLIWNLYKIFLIKFQKDDKKKNRKRAQRSVYVKYLHVELQVYDSL